VKKLWLRLVRYLARHELHKAFEAGATAEKLNSAMQLQMAQALIYSRGLAAGRDEMYECIARSVEERTGGMGDYVTPEDLKRAKKGLLH
jgi:hypothetical protein